MTKKKRLDLNAPTVGKLVQTVPGEDPVVLFIQSEYPDQDVEFRSRRMHLSPHLARQLRVMTMRAETVEGKPTVAFYCCLKHEPSFYGFDTLEKAVLFLADMGHCSMFKVIRKGEPCKTTVNC